MKQQNKNSQKDIFGKDFLKNVEVARDIILGDDKIRNAKLFIPNKNNRTKKKDNDYSGDVIVITDPKVITHNESRMNVLKKYIIGLADEHKYDTLSLFYKNVTHVIMECINIDNIDDFAKINNNPIVRENFFRFITGNLFAEKDENGDFCKDSVLEVLEKEQLTMLQEIFNHILPRGLFNEKFPNDNYYDRYELDNELIDEFISEKIKFLKNFQKYAIDGTNDKRIVKLINKIFTNSEHSDMDGKDTDNLSLLSEFSM